jgi:Zn-dependent protease with chaperone function
VTQPARRSSAGWLIFFALAWVFNLGLAFYILRNDLAETALIIVGVIVLAVGLAMFASAMSRRRRGIPEPAKSGPVGGSTGTLALAVLYLVLGLAATGIGLVQLFLNELEQQQENSAGQPGVSASSARRLAS